MGKKCVIGESFPMQIDGQVFKFSETPLKKLVFAPSRTIISKYIEEGISAQATLNKDADKDIKEIMIFVQGESVVTIPLTEEVAANKLRLTDARGRKVKFKKSKKAIRIDLSDIRGRATLSLAWD